ncbi:MAG: hypothetical protein ABJB11_04370 [Ferruginibacter sp.]
MKTTNHLPFSLKTTFFVSVILSLFLFSCKKENSTADAFHVTCTVDGVPMVFNAGAFAHWDSLGNEKALTINGLTDLTPNTGSVGFVITNTPSSNPITEAVYNDNSTNYEVLASYAPNISNLDYNAGTSEYGEAISNNFTIINHFSVHLTSLTAKAAKGTFSGDFFLGGDFAAGKKTITNGDFYVEFK